MKKKFKQLLFITTTLSLVFGTYDLSFADEEEHTHSYQEMFFTGIDCPNSSEENKHSYSVYVCECNDIYGYCWDCDSQFDYPMSSLEKYIEETKDSLEKQVRNYTGKRLQMLYEPYTYTNDESLEESAVSSFINAAINIAKDDSHGYQNEINKNLGNPNYDCGTFITEAAYQAGMLDEPLQIGTYIEPLGESLHNKQLLLDSGFQEFNYSDIKDNLKDGDILCSGGHVAIYVYGKLLHAHGGNKDNKDGDSLEIEIGFSDFYDCGWTTVFRYPNPPYISLEDKTIDYTGEIISIDDAKTTSFGNITYKYYTDAAHSLLTNESNGSLEEGSAPSNAGTYYVVAYIESDGFYDESRSNFAKLVISDPVEETTAEPKSEPEADITTEEVTETTSETTIQETTTTKETTTSVIVTTKEHITVQKTTKETTTAFEREY